MILQAIDAGYVYGFSMMEMAGLPSGAVYPATHARLQGRVFAFRWALIDQRRRCPVCLRP